MTTKPFRPNARGLFVLGSLLGTALATLVLASAPLLAAPSKSKPKLLLLPIVVHSSEDPEYVRDGLADMLTARFARIGALELVHLNDAGKGTNNLAAARVLGRKAGADFVLYGSFTRFGQGASLDVECAAVAEGDGPEPLREIFVHSGSIGEIIPDLDDLAGKVSRFARGEIVAPTPATTPAEVAGGATGAAPAAPAAAESAELQDLTQRVESLEESVTQILQSQDSSPGSDGGAQKLR